MNSEEIRHSVEPKSDQINADDLISGPLTVSVEAVKQGPSAEQPINIHVTGLDRPWRPSKSMRRVMIAVWGDNGNDWVGQSMTLYCDPSVKFGGVAVGGIRISHMTGLESPRDLMLTTTRSKRSAYTVSPLQIDTAPAWDYETIMHALGDCADADTLKTLKAAARTVYKTSTKEQQAALTAAIKAASEQE